MGDRLADRHQPRRMNEFMDCCSFLSQLWQLSYLLADEHAAGVLAMAFFHGAVDADDVGTSHAGWHLALGPANAKLAVQELTRWQKAKRLLVIRKGLQRQTLLQHGVQTFLHAQAAPRQPGGNGRATLRRNHQAGHIKPVMLAALLQRNVAFCLPRRMPAALVGELVSADQVQASSCCIVDDR